MAKQPTPNDEPIYGWRRALIWAGWLLFCFGFWVSVAYLIAWAW